MGTYDIKLLPEVIWAAVVAAVVALGLVISGVPVDQLLSDPQAVVAIAVAAVARAAGAAIQNGIAKLTNQGD